MAEPDFSGKTVVITGAGRGLGFGMARRFGQVGAHVVVAELVAERGRRAVEQLQREGWSSSFEPLDVRDPKQSVALVDKVVEEHGQIEVWVNNAGVAHIGPAETLPLELHGESGYSHAHRDVGR
jgi:NAD(P)-dependent dehydrogenase (short-subunit alcohol dehydrogenase family)